MEACNEDVDVEEIVSTMSHLQLTMKASKLVKVAKWVPHNINPMYITPEGIEKIIATLDTVKYTWCKFGKEWWYTISFPMPSATTRIWYKLVYQYTDNYMWDIKIKEYYEFLTSSTACP